MIYNTFPKWMMEDYCGYNIIWGVFVSNPLDYPLITLNLHVKGFLQGSVYPRNTLIQPAPLTLPPSERSLATPSFRTTDVGRGQYNSDYLRIVVGIRAWEQHKHKKCWTLTTSSTRYTITVYDTDEGNNEGKQSKGHGCAYWVHMKTRPLRGHTGFDLLSYQ
jgi:hypothetical protein